MQVQRSLDRWLFAMLPVLLGIALLTPRSAPTQTPAATSAATAAPAFSPAGGTYTSAENVTVTDNTRHAAIFYTTDGSKPTVSSNSYNRAIVVAKSETINAIAIAPGLSQSPEASATYSVTSPAAAPSFSVAPGTYNSPQTVSIVESTPGAAIYYTSNGSAPTTSSFPYIVPLNVAQTTTINAVAMGPGFSPSPLVSATYTISPPAAAPTYSVAPGTYNSTQTVSILSSTPGAVIFYTTNGSAPTTRSLPYINSILVAQTTTVNAVAIGQGYSQSTVTAATYTITPQAAIPVSVPVAGTFTSTQLVKLFDLTPGVTIYYTVDGSTPTASSTPYTGALTVSITETLNAIAIAPGVSQSAMASATYTIVPLAAQPVFSPPSSTYISSQSIAISDSTPGAIVYYTANGTAPTPSSTRYTGPIQVQATQTINAVATAPGYSQSMPATAPYTITPPALAPTFSLSGGTYTQSQTVTIADGITGATIYYTTNGTPPNLSSNRYTGPLAVQATETLQAIAVAPSYSQSAAVAATYTIAPLAAMPRLTPAGGTYIKAQMVAISSTTPGTALYYTADGSAPSLSSTLYSGPVVVTSNETISAIAFAANDSPSPIASATYVIAPPAAIPAITPPTGTYTSSQTVALADSTPNAAIYYTIDGTIPTASSTQYAGAIAVAANQTIKAIALAPGYSLSSVAAATYVITPPAAAPVFAPGGGTYTAAQTVAIADATPGATIYYTTTGVAPTGSSLQYAGPINVSATQSINAIAMAPGYSQSSVAASTFTIESALNITLPSGLPSGYVGASYGAAIQASGGGPSYAWSVNGTAVPSSGSAALSANGLFFTSQGGASLAIGGTPASAGTISFSVSVIDVHSGNTAGPVTFSIAVNSPALLSLPAPTPGSLGPAIAHESYVGYLGVTGGAPPYTWTITGLPGTMTSLPGTPLSSVAGNGVTGYSGDGGPAVAAEIGDGGGTAIDGAGNLYFADSVTSRVRMVTPAGTISTIAGTGTPGYNGDNIPSTSAQLSNPIGIAVDAAGNLYIADAGNARVRMVSALTGQIATVAGTGTAGYNDDNFAASMAQLNWPAGVTIDSKGNIYIADSGNARVREISAITGAIATITGTGVGGYSGDNGPAAKAQLKNPFAVAIDGQGNVFVADLTGKAGATGVSGRIREISATGGIISTVAGNGTAGYNGDGIAGANAQFSNPIGIAVDQAGNLYIADAGNNRVRMMSVQAGVIETVAGTGNPGFNGDNIAAVGANVTSPQSVASDAAGNLYIADTSGRIRKVQTPSANSDIIIEGTPQTPGVIALEASVKDSTGATAGPIGYSINVTAPLTLALPAANPNSLPSAILNQVYSGVIVAAGGVPSYTWTVNGVKLANNGSAVKLAGGFIVSSSGGSNLSIGGTPTTLSPVSFRVSLQDRVGNSAATVTYSIYVVNAAGFQVSGQVSFVNCPAPAPGISLTINTTPPQMTSTDNAGLFTFYNVPGGSYIITPSSNAPTSVFYPSAQTVLVNGNSVPGIDFSAVLGYNVAGADSYVSGISGHVYLTLINQSCPGTPLGTSVGGSGPFVIRGVQPGTYTLEAWVDSLGYGMRNASDPTAIVSNVTVGFQNLAAVSVNPVQPAPVVLASAPAIQGGGGFGGGAMLDYLPIVDGNGLEQAMSYTVQWSTASSFNTIAGSRSFASSGANPPTVWMINSLRTGAAYYFRAQGVVGNSVSAWSNIYGPISIGVPSSGNTVSGTVTFSGPATGELFVGFQDGNTGKDYVIWIGSPVSPQAYSIKVPTGSNYSLFALIDQNRDGMVDTGDINGMAGIGTLAIASNVTQNITLPAANTASLTTRHFRQMTPSGSSDSYALGFEVGTTDILPWRVTILSGPNVLSPMDIGECGSCGDEPYNFWLSVGAAQPNPGDTYTLQLMDPSAMGGSFQNASTVVSGVVNEFATNPFPASGPGSGITPTFTWTDPPNAAGYTYQFLLTDANGNVLWQIPSIASGSLGFSSSIASIAWGADPTGANNPPTVSSLTPGQTYYWSIQVQDSNGNTAEMPVGFQP